MSYYNTYLKRIETSGSTTEKSMVEKKIRTFKKALKSNYNKETIKDKNNFSFDVMIFEKEGVGNYNKEVKEILSLVDYNLSVGSLIYWPRIDSYWLISENFETEKALFKGVINKASYKMNWRDLSKDKVYTTWAITSPIPENRIKNEDKNNLSYDVLNESLEITISGETEGSEILKRYTEIFINGKKWEINKIENFGENQLISIALIESSIDREKDDFDNEIVNGKVEIDFSLVTNLDNLEEIFLNDMIALNPILYRNDKIIEGSEFFVRAYNSVYFNDSIIFDKLGESRIEILYPEFDKRFIYTFTVVSNSVPEVVVLNIVGDFKVRALTERTYNIVKSINGKEVLLNGNWIIDEDYVSIVSFSNESIELKFNNKVGKTNLKYLDSINEVEIEKEIEIRPIFERS